MVQRWHLIRPILSVGCSRLMPRSNSEPLRVSKIGEGHRTRMVVRGDLLHLREIGWPSQTNSSPSGILQDHVVEIQHMIPSDFACRLRPASRTRSSRSFVRARSMLRLDRRTRSAPPAQLACHVTAFSHVLRFRSSKTSNPGTWKRHLRVVCKKHKTAKGNTDSARAQRRLSLWPPMCMPRPKIGTKKKEAMGSAITFHVPMANAMVFCAHPAPPIRQLTGRGLDGTDRRVESRKKPLRSRSRSRITRYVELF